MIIFQKFSSIIKVKLYANIRLHVYARNYSNIKILKEKPTAFNDLGLILTTIRTHRFSNTQKQPNQSKKGPNHTFKNGFGKPQDQISFVFIFGCATQRLLPVALVALLSQRSQFRARSRQEHTRSAANRALPGWATLRSIFSFDRVHFPVVWVFFAGALKSIRAMQFVVVVFDVWKL